MHWLGWVIVVSLVSGTSVYGGDFVKRALEVVFGELSDALVAISRSRFMTMVWRGLALALWIPLLAGLSAYFMADTWIAKPLIFWGFVFSLAVIGSLWWLLDKLIAAADWLFLGSFAAGRRGIRLLVLGLLLWEINIGLILYVTGPTIALAPLMGLILALVAMILAGKVFNLPTTIMPWILYGYAAIIAVWCVGMMVPSFVYLTLTGEDWGKTFRFESPIRSVRLPESDARERDAMVALCERSLADIDAQIALAPSVQAAKPLRRRRKSILADCSE